MFNQTKTPSTTLAGQRRGFWISLRRAIGVIAACSVALAARGQTNVQTNAQTGAQTNSPPRVQPNDPLLNLLIKKGFVTLEEAQQLRSESDALNTNSNSASFSKWKIGDGIKSVELYGDLDCVTKAARSARPLAAGWIWTAIAIPCESALEAIWPDDFYYGLRLETASNPRSPWVTFGTSSTSTGIPYQGPFGKGPAGLGIGPGLRGLAAGQRN